MKWQTTNSNPGRMEPLAGGYFCIDKGQPFQFNYVLFSAMANEQLDV